MADADEDAATQAPRLFDGLAIHLTSYCPARQHYRELLETNGAKICKTDVGADVIITDHLKSKGAVERAYVS
ncbi:hypothetical protein ABW21_db0205016 [Orbilia brochopaga]|nr:hypothetical protein ABW21_db0205016 [Drechslerella brochopaga]